MAEQKYDTVIVGGGIAGLTSAAYLARGGQKVLLIEKNRELGGLVNSFTRDGFQFDAGVRALLNAGIILPMFEELGIKLECVKSPVSLGIGKEIINIENLDSLVEYGDLLKKTYPESEGDIDKVLQSIRKIMKHMDVLYGIENPVFKDLKNDREFLFKSLLPWLPKFIFTVRKINRLSMPVENYLENMVQNSSLRDIISQHFFRNTPTFFAMSYFSLYLDYFYPVAGVGKLAEAVQNKVLEYGGEIKTETRITELIADKCRVKDQNNISYGYDNLVWAADLKTLYRIADTEGLTTKVKANLGDVKKRMFASRGGDSVFTFFLGVDEPLESFRKIAHGHFFYTPSKLGMGETHRAELDSLLSNFNNVKKEEILSWLDRFTKLNTYEISIPGLKVPGLAPAGKTGLIISLLAEYDLFRKIHEAGWYDEFKTEFEDRILNVLSGSVYPMLKDKIIKRFSFTPLNIENRVGSSEGAITGWSFQKPVPVVNKIQISDRSVLTPVPTIYQAGQWAYSPAGVPMSILTGKIAADKILKKTGKKN
jgi:phytoene dehydrogenase-like protein